MADQTPFWKKEIHLGRRRANGATAIVVGPAPAALQPVDAPEVPEELPASDAFERYVEETADAVTVELEALVEAARRAVSGPMRPLPPEWPTFATAESEPVPATPEPLPLPPPAPEPPPAAETQEPPPAAESPEPEPEQPWWKQDASLRRLKTEVELSEAAEEPPKQPWWKKEVSFGRPAKQKPEPVESEEAEPVDSAPRQPWWKKDVSLRRPPSEPKAASPQPAQSLLKRDVRFSLPRLPQRGARAGAAKLVGLRVGSSQLAASVVNNNGSAELLQLARAPLSPGLVSAGEVRDPEALARALKRFFAASKLPRRGVRLGVATNRIGVRLLEVPAVDDPKLLANAIRFRAQEVLPFALSEAVLDHVVLGETIETGEGTQHRVLVVFAQRDLIDGYVEACKRAGIKLAGIDFEAFALLRALSAETAATEPRAALVAVAIGHERTIFAVSDGTTCELARVLDWGGANVDAALADALEIPVEEAAQLKETLGSDAEPNDAARQALQRELQVLARELLSSLQFYQSRSGSLDLSEVLLTGGGSQLAGIEEELGRQLGVPVRIADPLQSVTKGRKLRPPENLGSLAIAVGLGIER
jgi:type IV pilus assembly protein PilM